MQKGVVQVALALAVGVALGWGGARLSQHRDTPSADEGPWVARVGDATVGEARFLDEMRQRLGRSAGFDDPAQRQALLDALIYQQALVQAAREAGIDDEPQVARTLEQVLANQVLQRELKAREVDAQVSDDTVRAFYEANVDSYTVPARRRVAIIRIALPADADADAVAAAETSAAEALAASRELEEGVRHFGPVARRWSEDQASRYRGGVIGWISEGQRERYRHDPAVLDAAFALGQPGEVAGPVRGTDALYLVRLVDLEPAQARDYEALAPGIRQRLVQERVQQAEQAYRRELLSRYSIEINEPLLARIAPVSAKDASKTASTPQPPALPSEG